MDTCSGMCMDMRTGMWRGFRACVSTHMPTHVSAHMPALTCLHVRIPHEALVVRMAKGVVAVWCFFFNISEHADGERRGTVSI